MGGGCCLSFKGETRVSAAHFDEVLPGNAEAGITRGGNGNRRRKNKTGRSRLLMVGGGGRGLLSFLMSKCASALIRSGANLSEESARLFLITPRRIKIKSTGGFSRLSGAPPQLRCQIGPLRHGSLLPDWLVNSHHQIPAPPRSAVRRLERTGSRGLRPPQPHHPFVVKPFTLLSVWVVEAKKKRLSGCYCLRGRITDGRIISKTAFFQAPNNAAPLLPWRGSWKR